MTKEGYLGSNCWPTMGPGYVISKNCGNARNVAKKVVFHIHLYCAIH